MTKTHQIDFRDNLWLLTVSDRGDQMGFWTLASAASFAGNNLNAEYRLTNKAVCEMVKSGSRITCSRALSRRAA
jgi:hypothetical protein